MSLQLRLCAVVLLCAGLALTGLRRPEIQSIAPQTCKQALGILSKSTHLQRCHEPLEISAVELMQPEDCLSQAQHVLSPCLDAQPGGHQRSCVRPHGMLQ